MSEFLDQEQTRRDACCSLLRYLALGGMGLLWAGLYIRSSQSSAGTSCAQSLPCGGCSLQEECDLPQAMQARKKTRDNDHDKP